MTINFKKLESIASRDDINYKRYRDLDFLLKKINYELKNLECEYKNELNNLKKLGKRNSIIQLQGMSKQLNISIEKLYKPDVKLAVGFHGEMTNPLFFNFDSIMIDGKRIIEFFLRFLAVIMDETQPSKFENFFKGLKKEVNPSSQFGNRLYDDYRPYANFLITNWDNWINQLNDYRTNAIHKSVENRINGKVKTHWKPDSPIETLEIRSMTINFRDKDIIQFARDLESNLVKFYTEGCKFIIENFNSDQTK